MDEPSAMPGIFQLDITFFLARLPQKYVCTLYFQTVRPAFAARGFTAFTD